MDITEVGWFLILLVPFFVVFVFVCNHRLNKANEKSLLKIIVSIVAIAIKLLVLAFILFCLYKSFFIMKGFDE